MGRPEAVMKKMYCPHGFPPRLCNLCAVPPVCVHGMVRDCLLCNTQGLDSWYGKASTVGAAASVSAAASSLRLGVNERYRPAILLASKRTGLDPAGIAAVINAEAAALPSKAKAKRVDEVFRNNNPNRDWDKKPLDAKAPADAPLIKAWKDLYAGTAWDERSLNSVSHAAGLTQFVAGTWLDESVRIGTYLCDYAKEHGFLDTQGQPVHSRQNELLELRYNPTLSIVAAAEYDKYSLGKLSGRLIRSTTEVDKIFFARYPERDFTKERLDRGRDAALIKEWNQIFNAQPGTPMIPRDLTSDQKARYLYLCHHEGHDGAAQILDGSLTDAQAKYLFSFNVTDQATLDALIKKYGTYSKAYIGWLWSYIDQHIQPSGFRA